MSKSQHPSFLLGVALIFAGGVGNLLDREAHGGLAVDFINVGIGPVRTGVFNMADIAITFGGLMFFRWVLHQKE
ncbi:MAG: signal peptidase II [Proteobacteria bacterium]|nr:signal peptidase II [Pseudomonadota bacterium]